MSQPPVVRFAPSPTGYLHIGGARTAIFNWLFARRNKGTFILRIEDTDAQRSTPEAVAAIVDGLEWLGLDWDQGPYFQSRFAAEHLDAARALLAAGQAYKCFCTREQLEQKRQHARARKRSFQYDGACRHLSRDQIVAREAAGRPYTLRFKVPRGDGAVRFDDRVCGPIAKRHDDIEDFIIVRANNRPLYLLSNCVDDIRDGITHVIRGQDHLANTPKQILIYEALGAPIPDFAHMSLTLDPDKAKISKRRHGEMVAVHFYREKGFLPWALVNFLVLLGWATPDSRERFTRPALTEAFRLEGISRTNAVFDIRRDDPRFFTDPKALSINAHYLRTLPLAEILPPVTAQLKKAGLWDPAYEGEKRQWLCDTLELLRPRFQVTTDFVTRGRAFFADTFETDPDALEKHLLAHADFKHWLPAMADAIETLSPYTPQTIEAALRALIAEFKVTPNRLVTATRVAVSGQAVGPGIIEVLATLGRERVCRRLKTAARQFP